MAELSSAALTALWAARRIKGIKRQVAKEVRVEKPAEKTCVFTIALGA